MHYFRQKNNKNKQLSPELLEKLEQVIESSSPSHIRWLNKPHKFIIKNKEAVEEIIQSTFSLTFVAFKKFLRMVGCVVKKAGESRTFLLPEPTLVVPLAPQEKKQVKVYPDEISLEMSLRRGQIQKEGETQKEEKMCFDGITRFKENAKRANTLLDEAIMRVILGYAKGELNAEVYDLMAEAMDNMFDNQKQLETMSSHFKHKIQVESAQIKRQNEPVKLQEISQPLPKPE